MLELEFNQKPTETMNQPASQSQPDQETVAGSIEPDHFDDLLNDPQPGQDVAIDGNGYSDVILTKDDFHSLFCGGFEAASLISGLQSLHVEENDGKARAASAALYDTIADIPALQWMLKPGGKVMQRALVMAVFFGGMARNVSAELQARSVKAPDDQGPNGGTNNGITNYRGLSGEAA